MQKFLKNRNFKTLSYVGSPERPRIHVRICVQTQCMHARIKSKQDRKGKMAGLRLSAAIKGRGGNVLASVYA